MNRTIKFRAWHKFKKEMIPVTSIEFRDGELSRIVADVEGVLDFMPEEGALMQFTGLIDKGGKEIYEGDIVATGLGENYTKSIVRIGHAETEGSDNCYAEEYYGVYLEGSAGLLDELLHQRMYVIGNIYDNPLQG